MKMNVSLQAALQTALTILQGLNITTVPIQARFWVMLAISALQGVIGIIALFHNPDGTPASTPYNPQK